MTTAKFAQGAERELTSPRAREFYRAWMKDRRFNREFYRSMPHDRLDSRIVDAVTRRADSARDSLLYLMYVTRNYAYSVKASCAGVPSASRC